MTTPTDNPLPKRYSDATGKGDIHIPGAGSFGMVMLLLSLTMLFAASSAAYLLIRFKTTPWPPPGFPPIPNSLWLSTIVIVLSSFTIHSALRAVRSASPNAEKKLTRMLAATFALGSLFLLLQIFNWFEFYSQIPKDAQIQGAYLGMFFVLTALHAAHVLGGLIPLAITLAKARRGRYSPNYHPGVRYITAYWHFLDLIWLALFLILYF